MSSITEQLFDNEGRPVFVVAVGKSMKGKSYLVRYLLTERFLKGKLKFGIVFTKTKFNKDYAFLPDKSVKQGYNEEVLKKYISNIEKLREKKEGIPPNYLIFDDLVGVLNNQSDWFINFVSTARHFNTSVFICVQYLTGKKAISPIMREQTTHAIMFNSRTRRTLENLYESYGGLFPSFEEFKQYFFRATKERYTAMLYVESIDEVEGNYISIQAPENYPKIKVSF